MDGPPPAKRPRLSLACNECRRRKVKCDARYPNCRNCSLRNAVCLTTDPKRPGVKVTREWLDMGDHPQHSATSEPQTPPNTSRLPAQNVSQRSLRASVHDPSQMHQILHGAGDRLAATRSEGLEPDQGISPVLQPYDMSFTMDHKNDKFKMMGGSSSQCLTKSLDVYLKAANIQPVSTAFRHWMQSAEEMTIPLRVSLPLFPEPQKMEAYLSAFFEKIQPIFPIFDVDECKNHVRQLALLGDFASLPHGKVPILSCAYLVLSLGADEGAQQFTEDGLKYLKAAASFLGHVILMPYLPAVQALLLFTVAYRGRNKEGVGWQTLGMAIRIAHTLGLHRHSAINPSSQHGIQHRGKQLFHARIWAICCSLEKVMQLESGRPSLIGAVDCDQMMGRDQHPRGHDFLQWHMGLAQHQGLISEHIYGHGGGKCTARQILLDTARLDRSLLSWASNIPEQFRPGNDLFCASHELHIAAYISIQYHQTMIALHRAALIAPMVTFCAEVDTHCVDDLSRLRLRAGEAICVSSARSIAKLAIELSDRDIESRILTGGPTLLAAIVLGISLLKNPGRRLQATDLELFKACIDQAAEQYKKSGQNADFAKGIISIYDQVQLYTNRRSHLAASTPDLTMSNVHGFLKHQTGVNNHQISPRAELGNSNNLRRTSDIHSATYAPNYGHSTIINVDAGQNIATDDGVQSATTKGPIATELNRITIMANEQSLEFTNGASVNTEIGTTMIVSPEIDQDPDLYRFDQVPFENLNVEEIWSWMIAADAENAQFTESSWD